MPKLPCLTAKKVLKILEKKGFVLKRVTGSHYIFAHLEIKKRVTVPYQGKEIAKRTLLQILPEDPCVSVSDMERAASPYSCQVPRGHGVRGAVRP